MQQTLTETRRKVMDGSDGKGDDSTSKNENEVKFRLHFWTKLEDELGTFVPHHVKNILKFNNLDNPVSFRGMTDEIIGELEKFAKTAMLPLIEEDGQDLKEYYGIFYRKPENFQFVIGDKILIKQLVDFVKSKPLDYWGRIRTSKQHNMTSGSNPSTNRPFDIDTQAEKRKLQRQMKTMFSKNCTELSEPMRVKLEKELLIDVMAKQNFENNTTIYEATIACPLCSNVISFTKVSETGKSKTRWITSNFKRHVMTHSGDVNRTKVHHKNPQPTETLGTASTSVMPNSNEMNIYERVLDSSVLQEETPPTFCDLTSAGNPTTAIGEAIAALSSDLPYNEERPGE